MKALRQTQADLRAALTPQRARVERLLLAERSWRLADWRARYLDHPLLRLFARPLIWTFSDDERQAQGLWQASAIMEANGRRLDWLADETRVALWHPLDSPADVVLAWRHALDAAGVTQPFKQAWREVYLPTDAERATATYSNRFAAYIVRQHQFSALCQQRGWRYRPQGAWDGHNTPTLDLPRWNLRAEHAVDGGDGDDAALSGHGMYLTVGTGELRFSRLDVPAGPFFQPPVALEAVPPRVFSEVMRDLDLFVNVCSVGNDPNWLDAGPPEQRDYWHGYAYGGLTATARSRAEALRRLLPALRQLGGRWELDGRWLRVRSDLRAYRIHIGSGNAQLEPHGQHLCIVQGGGAGDLQLPFDGDSLLSLIVSKALLLANDRAITDSVILRQFDAAARSEQA